MAAVTSTTSTSNAITALGAGSGIDVQSLATNLVEAERAPRKAHFTPRQTRRAPLSFKRKSRNLRVASLATLPLSLS
jgi:hypothetical protein